MLLKSYKRVKNTNEFMPLFAKFLQGKNNEKRHNFAILLLYYVNIRIKKRPPLFLRQLAHFIFKTAALSCRAAVFLCVQAILRHL